MQVLPVWVGAPCARRLLLATVLALAAAAPALPAAAAADTVVGSTAVGPTVDTDSAGQAEAFKATAPASARFDRLNVYLDTSSTAIRVFVGVYASASSGTPASRVAACTVTAPKSGAWNSCAASGSVVAGRTYWVAVLQPRGSSGRLRFRDAGSSGTSWLSRSSRLTVLPTWYHAGSRSTGSPASIYASNSVTPPPPPPPPPDTTPPDTQITTHPSDGTQSTDASFGFTSSEPGSTFTCSLDGATAACQSPKTYSGLAIGRHSFAVAATDQAGNTDPSPASFTWTISASAPLPPPGAGFPNATTTGVPLGWQPAQTRSTTLVVTTPGAMVENIRFTGGASLDVRADNVTIRNVEFAGSGQIIGDNGTNPDCSNGALIQNVSFTYPESLGPYDPRGTPAIQWIGATVDHVKIVPGRSEGIFVGGKSEGCGPMVIKDSLIKVDDNGDCVLHADGVQGYDGAAVTIRNVTSDSSQANCGTAPFFYPRGQGNTSADIDGLLVIGGTYSFRDGMPSTVRNLNIVDQGGTGMNPYGSGHPWAYGPIDVNCPAMSVWDARRVTVDGNPREVGGSNYTITGALGSQPCNTGSGGN